MAEKMTCLFMSPPATFHRIPLSYNSMNNCHVEYFNIKSPYLKQFNRKRAMKL